MSDRGISFKYKGSEIAQLSGDGSIKLLTKNKLMEDDLEVDINRDVTIISKSVTQNGVYEASDDDADGYDTVTVNVPNTYTAGDDGKVVDNGELVTQGSQTVTQNGTYDTTLISELIANIAGGGGDGSFIDPKHIDINTDSVFASILSGYPQFNGITAFGGNQKKNWWGANNTAQHWISVTFEEAECINKIEFSNTFKEGSSQWQSTSVIFQGSNDNSTWTDLLTLTNLALSETPEIYNVNNNTKYLYYRFLCTSGGQFYTGLGKIRLYGKGSGGGGAKNILKGTTAPTSADGSNGDIYLQYIGIPSAYTQVEYIEGDGSQYIDTNLVADTDTEMEVDFSIEANVNSWQFVFGANSSNVNNSFLFGINGITNTTYQRGTNVYSDTAYSFNLGDVYSVKTHKNKIYLNDSLLTQVGNSVVNTPVSLALFAVHQSSGFNNILSAYKAYGAKIWQDGELIRYFVPCVRNSDSVAGFFDVINQQFYASSGNDDYIAGQSATPLDNILSAYCKVNGTWQALVGTDIDDVNTGE